MSQQNHHCENANVSYTNNKSNQIRSIDRSHFQLRTKKMGFKIDTCASASGSSLQEAMIEFFARRISPKEAPSVTPSTSLAPFHRPPRRRRVVRPRHRFRHELRHGPPRRLWWERGGSEPDGDSYGLRRPFRRLGFFFFLTRVAHRRNKKKSLVRLGCGAHA